MLALSFTFPAGRYHATPWDRHVNEGAVAWPPEPWRICRALIATWHHKIKPLSNSTEKTLGTLIEALASELPHYGLPTAIHSHTRHYMPQFRGSKRLIFDGFMAVGKTAPLTVSWPNLTLSKSETELLDELLKSMTYLGRAESWIEAQRLDELPESNCIPGSKTVDLTTGEVLGEEVSLLAPLQNQAYQAVREQFLSKRKPSKQFKSTLPEPLVEALSVETGALRKQGWNQPPAAHWQSYIRPLSTQRVKYQTRILKRKPAITAQFVLVGKPLPRVESSLHIGELARSAVMHLSAREFGPDNIPPALSGHGMPEGNRHQHAFYLPWDSDGDGRIDRLIVHVPAGMSDKEQRAIEKMRYLRDRKGSEWRTILEDIGSDMQNLVLASSRTWQTVTPWLYPWHVKRNFDVTAQIERECQERSLPPPASIQWLDTVQVGNTPRRPVHFKRFRNRRVTHQPDRLGRFCRLTFSEEVRGPIALGFGCHFGLGLFLPCKTG